MTAAVATGNGYRAGELIVSRSRIAHAAASALDPIQQRVLVADSVDHVAFCRGVERIVAQALRWNLKLHKVHVGGLLKDVMELCCQYHVPLEGKYASIVVSIAVLEAVGRKLDPDLDILSVALPIILQSRLQQTLKH